MLKLLSAMTYVCLACVTVLTLWHVILGKESSAFLLALMGMLIGATIAKVATAPDTKPEVGDKTTLNRVED